MSDTWIFNPPPMFPAPDIFNLSPMFPPPDMFTIPPRPEPNKLSTLQIILLTIVGILAFIVGVYLWKHYKPDDEEEGDMKNNAPEIDLESNQRLSNSKVEAKRQLGSTKHVKKSAKKVNADEGDMVHGYDKRLSSSNVNAHYFRNFMNATYEKDAQNRYAKDTKKSKASKEELESEFGDESSSSQSEKDTKKRNASKEDLESEFDEESSSSEGEKIHSRQCTKVNFARDSKKNNTSGRDARSSFGKF